jgi:Protein of unknown function (DUF2510)
VTVTDTPSRPRSVTAALLLLAGGTAVAYVVMLAHMLGDPPDVSTTSAVSSAVLWFWVAVFTVFAALPFALYIAMAFRKRWAYFVNFVLFGLTLLSALSSLGDTFDRGALTGAWSLGGWGVQIAAIVLLVRPPARDWFAYGRTQDAEPGEWRADPTGRHQYRFWDGRAWTTHVADDGQVGDDPLDEPPQACP